MQQRRLAPLVVGRALAHKAQEIIVHDGRTGIQRRSRTHLLVQFSVVQAANQLLGHEPRKESRAVREQRNEAIHEKLARNDPVVLARKNRGLLRTSFQSRLSRFDTTRAAANDHHTLALEIVLVELR